MHLTDGEKPAYMRIMAAKGAGNVRIAWRMIAHGVIAQVAIVLRQIELYQHTMITPNLGRMSSAI